MQTFYYQLAILPSWNHCITLISYSRGSVSPIAYCGVTPPFRKQATTAFCVTASQIIRGSFYLWPTITWADPPPLTICRTSVI